MASGEERGAGRQPAWRRSGQEPDYRFSLANERTFLAWIRSALALMAHLGLDPQPPPRGRAREVGQD